MTGLHILFTSPIQMCIALPHPDGPLFKYAQVPWPHHQFLLRCRQQLLYRAVSEGLHISFQHSHFQRFVIAVSCVGCIHGLPIFKLKAGEDKKDATVEFEMPGWIVCTKNHQAGDMRVGCWGKHPHNMALIQTKVAVVRPLISKHIVRRFRKPGHSQNRMESHDFA